MHSYDSQNMIDNIETTMQQLQEISHHAEKIFIGKVKPGEGERLPHEFFKMKEDDPPTESAEPPADAPGPSSAAPSSSAPDASPWQHRASFLD